VRKAISDARLGPATWYERLAPEHREELDAIKADWVAGELGKRKKTLARALPVTIGHVAISAVGFRGESAGLEKPKEQMSPETSPRIRCQRLLPPALTLSK